MTPLRISIALSIMALLATASTGSAAPGHPDASTVRAALEHQAQAQSSSSNVASQPAAQATSALTQFSMRGSGAETPNSISGTCSGAPCNASNDDCACLTYAGTLNATDVGNANWSASVTVNLNDCTNTGTSTTSGGGFCCYGDGTLNATTGSGNSASTLAMSFTGPVCNDPNASDDTSIQGGFIIVTSDSTGKFLHSAGTGEVNFFEATDMTTYLAGNGVIQLVSPF